MGWGCVSAAASPTADDPLPEVNRVSLVLELVQPQLSLDPSPTLCDR